MTVDKQAGQQARLGCFGSAALGAGTSGEPVANRGPGLVIDQCWMLTRIEQTLMCNPTGVNRVRQYSVEVSAREGCATALGAIRRRAALRPQSEPICCVFDPAHATVFTIQCEDATDSLGLGGIDDECTLACAVAEWRVAAHP